jgi:hypothetical protein
MKIKLYVFALFLSLAAAAAFGKTTTNTLYFGSTGFAISDGIDAISEGIVIAGFRNVVSPKDTGFYYGSDLSLGIPLTLYYFDDLYGFATMATEDDLFMGLKVPLGYRWPGTGRSMGFYLGAGPALQMIVDWDSAAVYGIGGFAELGWQTNKTSNVGFHFGFQLGLSPIVFSPGYGSLSGINASEASLRFGMSWRRIKS